MMSQRRLTLVTSTSTSEKMLFLVVADSGKPKEKEEETVILSREAQENVSPVANTSSESSEEKFGIGFVKPVSDASTQDQTVVNPSPTDQPGPNHHKRDAVAAAKERFLASKKGEGTMSGSPLSQVSVGTQFIAVSSFHRADGLDAR